MPVLDFEAYELEYFVEGQNGGYDDNGDYIPDEGEWVKYGRCNAVPAGRNNVIALPDEDGRQITFSFTIILHNPKAREFAFGDKIRLTTVSGMEKKELTVKGFARYQWQCKIYA